MAAEKARVDREHPRPEQGNGGGHDGQFQQGRLSFKLVLRDHRKPGERIGEGGKRYQEADHWREKSDQKQSPASGQQQTGEKVTHLAAVIGEANQALRESHSAYDDTHQKQRGSRPAARKRGK